MRRDKLAKIVLTNSVERADLQERHPRIGRQFMRDNISQAAANIQRRFADQNGGRKAALVTESANNNPRVADAIRDALKLYEGVLAGIVRYGQKKQELRDDINPDAFAHSVLGTHMGMIIYQQLFPDVTYDSMCDAVDTPMLEGIDRPHRR